MEVVMRSVWLGVLGVVLCGCPSSGDDKDTDGSDTQPQDTDTPDTDGLGLDTGDDTDIPAPCGGGEPVLVRATTTKGWIVPEAEVRWVLEDGRSGDCDLLPPPDFYDTWSCDAPLEGDLWVTVTHPFLRGYVEKIDAGVDDCREGGEQLNGLTTMTPSGTFFPESRVYTNRRYEDQEECDNAFMLYGQSCYATTFFCADGYSVVLETDIINDGSYQILPDGTVVNHLFLEGDIPADTVWTAVDANTLRAWNTAVWVWDPTYPAYFCSDFVPDDTGGWDSGDTAVETDSDMDSDMDTDTDTDTTP